MECPDCKRLRHEGECPACEACGWPLAPGQDRLCQECDLELAQIDAEQSAQRFQEAIKHAH